MLCQNCQKRIANVHFTQTVNGKKTEMYLCEQCANEMGQTDIVPHFSMGDFFPVLIGFVNSAPSPYIPAVQQEQDKVCDVCGMAYSEFLKAGKLGCGNCYKIFGDKLNPIIKRLHGNTEHLGKVPGNLSKNIKASKEIEKLREDLNKAIQNEEYEKAAQLRDKIKAIETAGVE